MDGPRLHAPVVPAQETGYEPVSIACVGRCAARRCVAVARIRDGLAVDPVSVGTAGLIQGFPTAALRSGLKAVQHQLSGLFTE